MVLTAEQFRQRRALQKYKRNAADKLVRASAFRECDYTEVGQLREFTTEAEVLAFEAARYEDGTSSKVKFWNKPKATVAPEQLAIEATTAYAVAEDGNQTRVQLAGVEEGIHARMVRKELGGIELAVAKRNSVHGHRRLRKKTAMRACMAVFRDKEIVRALFDMAGNAIPLQWLVPLLRPVASCIDLRGPILLSNGFGQGVHTNSCAMLA